MLWKPRNLPLEIGGRHTTHGITNTATTREKGNMMSILAAPGGEDVHHGTTDTPKAKSKTMRLHVGAVPGTWTVVRVSLAPKRPIAQKHTGPKYFPPCLDDVTEHAEDSHAHIVDLASAGGLAATPQTYQPTMNQI